MQSVAPCGFATIPDGFPRLQNAACIKTNFLFLTFNDNDENLPHGVLGFWGFGVVDGDLVFWNVVGSRNDQV